MTSRVEKYFITLGDALSQLCNALLFNSKNANESISGRSYYLKDQSKFWRFMYNFINLLFYLQDDHCKLAYYSDLNRARVLIEDYSKWKTLKNID